MEIKIVMLDFGGTKTFEEERTTTDKYIMNILGKYRTLWTYIGMLTMKHHEILTNYGTVEI